MTQPIVQPLALVRPKHIEPNYVAMLERAEEAAENRFELGEVEQNALLERVAGMVIRDRLVPPAQAEFQVCADANEDPELRIKYASGPELITIHKHALSQLAQKVELPIAFAHSLNVHDKERTWRSDLLAHNLNTLFHKTQWGLDKQGRPMRFLHRLVGTEIRGFLSRRFNRHLASAPLLRAFVESCKEVTARPIEAVSSDVRFSLKCYLPHVFEAYPGQYICVGAEWTNSDFGVGKHLVSQSIWDPLRNTGAVLDDSISQVHLGSIIEDSDIEMSDDTAAKEVEAQAGAIHDAVKTMLSNQSIKRLLDAIRIANEQEVPWSKLKGQLSRFLYKKDIESIEAILNGSDDIIDLPPPGRTADGRAIPTKWWISSLVSTMAARTKDEDRKIELQHEAGKMLAGLIEKGA